MQGYAAYQRVQNVTENPRDTEYRLLGKVTGALMRSRDGEATLQDKIKAVLWNNKIWQAFMIDLSDPGNALPKDLRRNLIRLAVWVGGETQRVLDNEVDLEGLININRQIMEGLKSQMALSGNAA